MEKSKGCLHILQRSGCQLVTTCKSFQVFEHGPTAENRMGCPVRLNEAPITGGTLVETGIHHRDGL